MKNKLFWGVLLLCVCLFWVLNQYTSIYMEDISYMYIFGNDTVKVQNMHDIVVSQQYFYNNINGRTIVQLLNQIFMCFFDKYFFNICNAFVFGLYIFLICKISNIKYNVFLLLIAISCIWLLMPSFSDSFLWLCGTFSGLWAITLCLIGLWIIFREKELNKKRPWWYGLLMLIICFFSGWSHEGIVLGVSGGIALHYLFNIKQFKGAVVFPIIGFAMGVIMMLIAPANIHRFTEGDGSGSSFSALGLAKNFAQVFFMIRIFYVFAVLFIVLWIKHRADCKKFIHNNDILLYAIVISLLFLLVIGYIGNGRAFVGVETISLILTIKLLNVFIHKDFFKEKYVRYAAYALTAISLIIYVPALIGNINNYGKTQAMYENVEQTSDNLIAVVPYDGKLNRLVFQGFKAKSGPVHRADWWENQLLAKYYGKTGVSILPEKFYNQIYNADNFCTSQNKVFDGLYTNKDLGFYVMKTDSAYNQQDLNEINVQFDLDKFMLKDFVELAWHKMAPSNFSAGVQDRKGAVSLLNVPSGKYLLIDKIKGVNDRRVKSLKIDNK